MLWLVAAVLDAQSAVLACRHQVLHVHMIICGQDIIHHQHTCIVEMQDEANTYCGAEITLSEQYATKASGAWWSVSIPLSAWRCDEGSVGSLTAVDRVDMQNTNIRDANICVDNIALV